MYIDFPLQFYSIYLLGLKTAVIITFAENKHYHRKKTVQHRKWILLLLDKVTIYIQIYRFELLKTDHYFYIFASTYYKVVTRQVRLSQSSSANFRLLSRDID